MSVHFIPPAPYHLPPRILKARLRQVIRDAKVLLLVLEEESRPCVDPFEDMEPEAGYDLPEGDDERCASSEVDDEPSLGAPENHPARYHFDMEDFYHVGRTRHPLGDQTHWSAGGVSDCEGEHDGREHEAGYDQPEGDDERCGSDDVEGEHDLGWTACINQTNLGRNAPDGDETALERFGQGFIRSGPDDGEDSDPGEEDHCDHPADSGGAAEQFAGTGLVPALQFSVGGYVA